MRVKLHDSTNDVRALGSRTSEKTHRVHRVEDLSVSGLKSVYLGNSTRNYNAHRIRHIVFLDRVGYELWQNGSVDYLLYFFVLFLFSRHLFKHLS